MSMNRDTGRAGQNDELQLQVPMLPNMELAVADMAGSLGAVVGFDPDEVDEIRLAVIEACLNAFEHSRAKLRRLSVRFQVGPSRLVMEITDQGRGFDPGLVPQPDIRKNLSGEQKRGWGLKIMSTLMDSAEVFSTADGTTVILSKSLQEACRDEAV